MIIQNSNQDIQDTLSLLERFRNESIDFLSERYYDIRQTAETPLWNLITSIPSLTFKAREYLLVNQEDGQLEDEIEDHFYEVHENLESITVNLEQIIHLWELFDEVCNELKNHICSYFLIDYKFDKLMGKINERIINHDYYKEGDVSTSLW
jgi:hypothetical protein